MFLVFSDDSLYTCHSKTKGHVSSNFPPDVDINDRMTITKLPDEGIFPSNQERIEHPHAEHKSLCYRTYLTMELKVLEEQRARPHACSPDPLKVLQTPDSRRSRTSQRLGSPWTSPSSSTVHKHQCVLALKSSPFIKSNNLGGYCSGPAKRSFVPST